MPILYDEDGNEVVEVESTEGLSDIIKGSAEQATELEELKAKHEDLATRYASLENKDFNFRQFEKATEEEKSKLMEKMTEIERASVQEISRLTSQIEQGEKTRQEGMKTKAIDALSAGDEDLKKELEKAYEKSLQFGGAPTTADEVATRMQEAYRYVKGVAPSVNALNSFVPNTPVIEKGNERFTETDKGKAMLQENFPHLYPKEEKKD